MKYFCVKITFYFNDFVENNAIYNHSKIVVVIKMVLPSFYEQACLMWFIKFVFVENNLLQMSQF